MENEKKNNKKKRKKKRVLLSDSDSDELVPTGMYEVKSLHGRKTYKPKKGLSSGGFQYLVEYVGYPDPNDFSWQFDYELDGAKSTIQSFNDQNHASAGEDACAVVPVVVSQADARQMWVDQQLVLYQQVHKCALKDVPDGVMAKMWDASFEHSKA